ncbi:MAG: histidine--tRNA ligase [Actinobacteria bacterium]|nr:histidine--tRNA ligase [Actinomycetota bacterium]
MDTGPASGTRDHLPPEVARRERVFALIREVFERHGFAPIDTPAFERLEVLTGKYGEEGDQLIFKILRRGEHGETGEADLALRYDLTVPLARYIAAHPELGTPFKRYHLGTVWRADRPGHGRFREFTQCDADTVGADSLVADAETLLTLDAALTALGLDGYTFELNSRPALRGLIEAYAIPPELEQSALVAIDKLDKVGPEGVATELAERGVSEQAAARFRADLEADDAADRVRERLGRTERGSAGLGEVDTVIELVDGHLQRGQVAFAPYLARGLDYYTGPIFEIRHAGLGSSIGSGGRYDGLLGMFSGREIPATGGSLGVERILLLLGEADVSESAPDVVVTVMDDSLRGDAIALATRLRRAGVRADLFVDSARMKKQLRYADRRGARFVIVRGADEVAAGTVGVKDLRSGEQVDVPVEALEERVQVLLAGDGRTELATDRSMTDGGTTP